MGRSEPSLGQPPASVRRDARAKKAKATLNKVIPSLLSAHPRARRGIEAAELIVDPAGSSRRRRASRPVGANAEVMAAGGSSSDRAEPRSFTTSPPHLSLRVADTLTAARALLDQDDTTVPSSSSWASSSSAPPVKNRPRRHHHAPAAQLPSSSASAPRVAILNMASPLAPGGGFLNGAHSQEESLCMRTTLLPALRDGFYRLPDLGVIYTPDVLVFRNEELAGTDEAAGTTSDVLPKRARFFVDVVSAAMLRFPETHVDEHGQGRYMEAADRELVRRKMRAVLRVCQAKGVRRVVLGAWGCGAYGNPVGEVAAAWRQTLLGNSGSKARPNGRKATAEPEAWHGIEEVVFAIKDASLADGFAAAFGEGLDRMEDDRASSGHEAEEDDPESIQVKELREKIQELETQLAHARTPQLQQGLHSVLVGLRSQLPEPSALPADEDSEGEDEQDGSDEGGEMPHCHPPV